jgi:hypothetical protein
MTNHIDNLVQLHERLEVHYHVDHYEAQLITNDGLRMVIEGRGETIRDAIADVERQAAGLTIDQVRQLPTIELLGERDTRDDFQREYLAEWPQASEAEIKAYQAVEEYHRRCDEFDRLVFGEDERRTLSAQGLSSSHAYVSRKLVIEDFGITHEQFQKAATDYSRRKMNVYENLKQRGTTP